MSDYTLLTGATGLVGRFLLRDLLSRGHRLALVVRPGARESARERVEEIMQHWDREEGSLLPRPVCLAGDINQPRLGLSATDYGWAEKHVSRMLHSAAVLDFFGSSQDDDPWRTNVGGTRNVLELCRELAIRDFHYVSTAYVCGTRPGTILEDDLDVGQGFRNDYEESKLQSETLVREADFLDPVTVYRPVVVGGDSRTGYTNTYHGIYAYLKLMSVLVWNTEPGPDQRRHTPVQLEMTGDERRNLVPADWVSAVICRLLETPAAHGGTYHLASRDPVTPRGVIEAGYEYFNSYGVEFIGPREDTAQAKSAMDQAARENRAIYQPYETTDPVFDTTNLDRFAADLPCPQVDAEMLHRFWKFAEADRWGKRRKTRPQVPAWIEDDLQSRVASERAARQASHPPLSLGLDIRGPGGGQWHLKLRGAEVSAVRPGLPKRVDSLLTCRVTDWYQFLDEARDEAIWRLEKALQVADGNPADLSNHVYTALFANGKTSRSQGADWLAATG